MVLIKWNPDRRGILVITHYQRLLEYIVLTLYMSWLKEKSSGWGKELALELEERGYDWVKQEVLTSTPQLHLL